MHSTLFCRVDRERVRLARTGPYGAVPLVIENEGPEDAQLASWLRYVPWEGRGASAMQACCDPAGGLQISAAATLHWGFQAQTAGV